MSIIGSGAFAATVVMALWAAFGADSRVSAYAAEHTPVYGSAARADRAGERFMQASVGIAALVYAVRYFDNIDDINIDNMRNIGGALGGSAYAPVMDATLSATEAAGAFVVSCAVTSTATEILKKQIGRPRPNRSDSLSYPSGHATAAAWANRYSALMTGDLGLSPPVRYTAGAALTLLTAGAAWGRVEAGRHHVSDVMAGAWVGMALTDAAFGLYRNDNYTNGVRFGIYTYNERGAATTVLSTTVEF
jgi:membrane-associated phospholipid phosphatase